MPTIRNRITRPGSVLHGQGHQCSCECTLKHSHANAAQWMLGETRMYIRGRAHTIQHIKALPRFGWARWNRHSLRSPSTTTTAGISTCCSRDALEPISPTRPRHQYYTTCTYTATPALTSRTPSSSISTAARQQHITEREVPQGVADLRRARGTGCLQTGIQVRHHGNTNLPRCWLCVCVGGGDDGRRK